MQAAISGITVQTYTIPTDRPEADGTFAWNSTTIVIAKIAAGGQTGLGYTYASRAAGVLIDDIFTPVLLGQNAFDIPACFDRMSRAARNLGLGSQVSAAMAAIDTALWDLKARLLNTSLADLMGASKMAVPVYGSGGFTTYDAKSIQAQIEGWRRQGITMAKIKIGTHPDQDVARVKAAREALSDNDRLFVDANGAYSVKEALEFAEKFRDFGVTWFEEPVSSDDLPGLRHIREHVPAGLDIAAGEYSFDLFSAQRMLEAKAVNVMQIDATRCQGYSGFMRAASLALAANIPLSSHCAPALHLPVCCHTPHMLHMEYFYDHVRIEKMLFDGTPEVKHGLLAPNRGRPGHGLVLKERDAERYAA